MTGPDQCLPSPLKPLLCCLAPPSCTSAPSHRCPASLSDLFVTLGQDPYCCADCLPPRPSPHKPLPSRPPPSLTAPAASTALTPVTTPFSISEKPKIVGVIVATSPALTPPPTEPLQKHSD
ncbi:hypothetical protein D9757_013946 [Collybiopsis confluens]|uniref:Uncharacterized protein n=1 Tax=Collybiopsis confluens TaxID=2823264 RepID=A0A8H5G8N0_9AGAR|nr:hypothetical protein D9757_013946 [Collybiopsis confluens]